MLFNQVDCLQYLFLSCHKFTTEFGPTTRHSNFCKLINFHMLDILMVETISNKYHNTSAEKQILIFDGFVMEVYDNDGDGDNDDGDVDERFETAFFL